MNVSLLLIVLRFVIGIAICPFITAVLVVSPHYVFDKANMLTQGYTVIVIYISYAVTITIGAPIALYLFTKNRCSYITFAIIGFILGFLSIFLFSYYLKIDTLTSYSHHRNIEIVNYFFTLNEFVDLTLTSIWYGICAAIGATLFAFISGVSPWYNKRVKSDA